MKTYWHRAYDQNGAARLWVVIQGEEDYHCETWRFESEKSLMLAWHALDAMNVSGGDPKHYANARQHAQVVSVDLRAPSQIEFFFVTPKHDRVLTVHSHAFLKEIGFFAPPS